MNSIYHMNTKLERLIGQKAAEKRGKGWAQKYSGGRKISELKRLHVCVD